MKTLSQKIIYLLALYFLTAAVEVNADFTTQTLTQPMSYCVQKDEWAGANNQLTYTHYLQIPQADQFKSGFVFVGFRFRNQPENLWLQRSQSGKWLQYSPAPGNFPEFFYAFDSLQPVIKLPVISQPTDVTAIVSLYAQAPKTAGEILVGYGLAAGTGNPIMNAYQDMISNNKFYMAWTLGENVGTFTDTYICLIASQVTSGSIGPIYVSGSTSLPITPSNP